MAVALDGSISGIANTAATSVTSGTLAPAASSGIIVAIIYNANPTGPPTVSSITASGSWARRAGLTGNYANISTFANLEYWWSAYSTGYSSTIKANFSGATDAADILAFGVSGANTSAPWDATGNTTTSNVTGVGSSPDGGSITPTSSNTFVFSVWGSSQNVSGSLNNPGTGYTRIVGTNTSGSADFAVADSQYRLSVSGAVPTAWSGSISFADWLLVADTIVGGGGGAAKLFRAPNLDGLGGGGPFFSNPLAAPAMSPRMRAVGWRKSKHLWLPERIAA